MRRKLWPLILGLTDDWKVCEWDKLNMEYEHYQKQWQSILPDQEQRFTAFRERKSIVGKLFALLIQAGFNHVSSSDRDVVRCDRSHPFYSDSTENLDKLRRLLMAYIMYDFDTGYVQGN